MKNTFQVINLVRRQPQRSLARRRAGTPSVTRITQTPYLMPPNGPRPNKNRERELRPNDPAESTTQIQPAALTTKPPLAHQFIMTSRSSMNPTMSSTPQL